MEGRSSSRWFAALVLATILAAPATAAGMEAAAQDDATVVCQQHDRDRALAQMRDMGATHVRIFYPHGRTICGRQYPVAAWDDAIAAVKAHGMVPQLNPTWNGEGDVDRIAEWLGRVAQHFYPAVRRFSVLNEPDLTLSTAGSDCDPVTIQSLVARHVLEARRVVQRRKVYLRRRARVRRHGKSRVVWRPVYRRVWRRVRVRRHGHVLRVRRHVYLRHHGHRVRAFKWRKVVRTVLADSTVHDSASTVSVAHGCFELRRGRLYRRIFLAAAPRIRAAAPGAQVLAGETSPVPGVATFIQAAMADGPLPGADGWAHHCYQWDATPEKDPGGGSLGIGATPQVKALVAGLPLYLTECGYPHVGADFGAGLFTHATLPGVLVRAWKFARDQGARQMAQFHWITQPDHHWDTSLMNADGSPSPEYDALRAFLTGS